MWLQKISFVCFLSFCLHFGILLLRWMSNKYQKSKQTSSSFWKFKRANIIKYCRYLTKIWRGYHPAVQPRSYWKFTWAIIQSPTVTLLKVYKGLHLKIPPVLYPDLTLTVPPMFCRQLSESLQSYTQSLSVTLPNVYRQQKERNWSLKAILFPWEPICAFGSIKLKL